MVPSHVLSLVRAHQMLRPNRDQRGRLVRGHGLRSRVPRQGRPLLVESQYAKAIWETVDVREALRPLLAELPDLLKTASASRNDEADAPELETKVAGLRVLIENPAGSTRHWTDSDGTQGSTLMRWSYGCLPDYVGADGEDVDVYLGPNPDPEVVHVVRQMSKASGFTEYDEDKVMLGWDRASDAAMAYVAQYDDPRFYGGMVSMPIYEFLMRLGASDGGPITRGVQRTDAGETGRVRAMIDRARKALGARLDTRKLEDLAQRYAGATSNFQRAQLARQVRAAIGVDLATSDPRVPALMEHFVGENVSLIRSLGNRTLDDVEKIVTRAFTSGSRADEIAGDIQDRFGVSERHARLIARDQIGKLNGQVNAARQQELGISRFTWRTVGDERVRDEHRALNGNVFSYDDPPEEGIPGEPINCRCSAEPYFADMLDELAGNGRAASGTGEDGGGSDEGVDREDWLERWYREDYSEDQPRDEHGRFGSGGGGVAAERAAADARATAPKPGETTEQHARRMAINAASRASKAKARAAALAAVSAQAAPPATQTAQTAPAAPAPPAAAPAAAALAAQAPPGPSSPAANQAPARPVAPQRSGESSEDYAKRLARNEASRQSKAAARARVIAAAPPSSPAPTAPVAQPAAPPPAAPIAAAPPAPQTSVVATAPKPGESPEQHAARMARNAASRQAKARARAAAIAARGEARLTSAAPASTPAQPTAAPARSSKAGKAAAAPKVYAETVNGYQANTAIPESGPRASAEEFGKAADSYERIRNTLPGSRVSLRPKEQKDLRQHLHRVLAPYGLHQADSNEHGGARLGIKSLHGARGLHSPTGAVTINRPVARNAAEFAHDQKTGVDYGEKIRAAGGNVSGVMPVLAPHQSMYPSAKQEAENLATKANDYRTHVHEALHGYGPRGMLSRSYAREGVIVEEVATEVSARKVVRDQLGLKHGDVRALSAPTHKHDNGSYVSEIYSTTRALHEAVKEGSSDPNMGSFHLSHSQAYEAVERASLRYKSMATHKDADSPEGSVRMFSSAVDFDHIEKIGGRKLTSDQRQKITDAFGRNIIAVGQGKKIY